MIKYPGSLHNHTDYSNLRLRDCINKTGDLIDYAIQLGHEVVAITDHECVSNSLVALRKYEKVKKDHPDFKLILGNEIYLCRNGLNAQNFRAGIDKYYHFILLAADIEGHEQIRQLSTRAWLRSYMARGMRRVPTYYQDLIDIIKPNKGHVIASSACLGGLLGTQLIKYRETNDSLLYQYILEWIDKMVDIFGEGNFYLELQPSATSEQTWVNRELLKIAELKNLQYIITTDSHYLRKDQAKIHKAYLNAQNGDREVDSFYATTYMMSDEEMRGYILKDMTEEQYQIACQNIVSIKKRCQDFSLKKPLKMPRLHWDEPEKLTHQQIKESAAEYIEKIPELGNFYNADFEGDKLLAELLIERMETDESYHNEATYEAVQDCLEKTRISSEVNQAHWSSYFLNLRDNIKECWNAGTLVGPGRGSGVGFILLPMLDITQINPLREKTRTFSWRFLNPARASVLDIDTDIEGSKRKQVIAHLEDVYGHDRVSQVATFKTEKAKSAILTAARGLGIDVDIASYLGSMVEADRGQQRTLKQTFYGDEENGFAANRNFVVEMTENYPELWEVAQTIEGLVCGYSSHAGGIIFVDEPFTSSAALMRTPKGEVITAFELHDCEDVSLIKIDLLSIEALDKIHNCIDLLCDYGAAERKSTLKETYESLVGIYGLEREDPKMWEMVWNHEIQALFQMEKQSGVQGIALIKPKSVDELAVLNSVIRLMASEKGAEQPLNKFARFKNDIRQWYNEMEEAGLTAEEMKILEPVVGESYGICESQEKFMALVQIPECGGFDLQFADKLRKSIAKKNPKGYEELRAQYFKETTEKGLSKNLCRYVFDTLVATSKGYGFRNS